jgi:hypothetical protein
MFTGVLRVWAMGPWLAVHANLFSFIDGPLPPFMHFLMCGPFSSGKVVIAEQGMHPFYVKTAPINGKCRDSRLHFQAPSLNL